MCAPSRTKQNDTIDEIGLLDPGYERIDRGVHATFVYTLPTIVQALVFVCQNRRVIPFTNAQRPNINHWRATPLTEDSSLELKTATANTFLAHIFFVIVIVPIDRIARNSAKFESTD